jgi:magnesium transporter
VHATAFGPSGSRPVTPAELPALLAAGRESVWVDLTGPDPEAQAALREVFRFHPLAIEDTLNQRQRPKVEEYGDHLFLILNPVTADGRLAFRELDVFVGRNFLVTVHPEEEPVIAQVRRRLPAGEGVPAPSPARILYLLLDTVVDGYFPCLDALGDRIDDLEERILGRPEAEGLRRLFDLKRTLVELRRVVAPQRDMLNVLTRRELEFLDQQDLQYHLRDVYDHLLRVTDMVDTYRDLLTGAVDLYMSAVSNRLNQVVNRLTAFTVVIGALAVVTGFYGMNFERTWPAFSAPWGVPFTLGAMAAAVGAFLLFFRASRGS